MATRGAWTFCSSSFGGVGAPQWPTSYPPPRVLSGLRAEGGPSSAHLLSGLAWASVSRQTLRRHLSLNSALIFTLPEYPRGKFKFYRAICVKQGDLYLLNSERMEVTADSRAKNSFAASSSEETAVHRGLWGVRPGEWTSSDESAPWPSAVLSFFSKQTYVK